MKACMEVLNQNQQPEYVEPPYIGNLHEWVSVLDVILSPALFLKYTPEEMDFFRVVTNPNRGSREYTRFADYYFGPKAFPLYYAGNRTAEEVFTMHLNGIRENSKESKRTYAEQMEYSKTECHAKWSDGVVAGLVRPGEPAFDEIMNNLYPEYYERWEDHYRMSPPKTEEERMRWPAGLLDRFDKKYAPPVDPGPPKARAFMMFLNAAGVLPEEAREEEIDGREPECFMDHDSDPEDTHPDNPLYTPPPKPEQDDDFSDKEEPAAPHTTNADHVALSDPLVPRGFAEYIGQARAKELMRLMIGSSEKRGEPIGHILFTGTGGTGKTAAAKALAQEIDCYFKFATATNMNTFRPEKGIDNLLEVLCEVNDVAWHGKKFGMLFLDEIHRLSPEQWERLYSVMEGGQFDAHVGLLDVKDTVIVGATTDPHLLPLSARTRFRIVELEPYTQDDMCKIIEQGAGKLDAGIEAPAVSLIADNARGNPRLALNTFVKTSIDVSAGMDEDVVSKEHVKKALDLCGVVNQKDGMTRNELRYLMFLNRQLREGNQTLGIQSLIAGLGEIRENIESIIEPFLLSNEYILRTSRGRKITQKGIAAVEKLAKNM